MLVLEKGRRNGNIRSEWFNSKRERTTGWQCNCRLNHHFRLEINFTILEDGSNRMSLSRTIFMNSVASTLNRVTGMEFNNQISVLTPNNWNTWKHDMQVLLMHYGCWQFIIQTKPEQTDEEATYKEKLDLQLHSDFATNRDDRVSMGGFITFIDETPISWRTFKQKSVSLSTMEAEYVSLTEAAKGIHLAKEFVSYRVLKMEVNKEKIRSILQIFFDKGEKASQVAEIVNGVYGDEML
ncbi:retrovirus-related Pol polyprotein from transposon TNT 1-94 [Trichonephila clavipes]|nr:retrovirus-related Pol polyprotein from transposon TNT 1-94 [Trichonephila clavipes]